MKHLRQHIPTLICVLLAGAALLHGPIAQLPGYHDFADHSTAFGIPHFADVLSNIGFALFAIWGLRRVAFARSNPAIVHGWSGYMLFIVALFCTAFGSSYYHLAPDNARLIWDRIPIVLACSGLLAGVWGDAHKRNSANLATGLAIASIASVAWWVVTENAGAGDLRPYLLLQGLPILVIPLWQWIHDTPRADRWAFGGALILYVAAKVVELNDHQIAAMLGHLTGHTLKHLLATAAAALIVIRLVRRINAQGSQTAVMPQQPGMPAKLADRADTVAMSCPDD